MSATDATSLSKLRHFVGAMTRVVEGAGPTEDRILSEGGALLAELVREDDWLPEAFGRPDERYYRRSA